jgi:hypothetical protein
MAVMPTTTTYSGKRSTTDSFTSHIHSHLDFYGQSKLLQQEIDSARISRVAWRPFLGSYIVEMKLQHSRKEILNVIFVGDFQGAPAVVSGLESICHYGCF